MLKIPIQHPSIPPRLEGNPTRQQPKKLPITSYIDTLSYPLIHSAYSIPHPDIPAKITTRMPHKKVLYIQRKLKDNDHGSIGGGRNDMISSYNNSLSCSLEISSLWTVRTNEGRKVNTIDSLEGDGRKRNGEKKTLTIKFEELGIERRSDGFIIRIVLY